MDVTLWTGQMLILHLEFQGPGSHRPMPLRVLDYQTRFALTVRDVPVHSVVIYLAGAGSTDTGMHEFLDVTVQPRLRWQYTVIRLWQLPAEELLALQRPALLALLGQTRIDHPAQVIPEALAQIERHTQGEQRERLLSELLLLCTDREVAAMVEQLIIRDYGLPETPMMRKLREEGRQEGRQEGQEALVLRLLTRRFGTLSRAISTHLAQLTSAQVLGLADALLDFHDLADLEAWLARCPPPDVDSPSTA